MQTEIRSPESDAEYDSYYSLRWALLRKPWKQPPGSEKDEHEENAIHRFALDGERVVGVARLHLLDNENAQIRYMAVTTGFKNQGIGTQLLESLETAAKKSNIKKIMLHSREDAVNFYSRHGYVLRGKSHLLYNEIQHYEMGKEI